MFLYELPDFRQARIIGAPAEQTCVIDKDHIAATAAIRDNGQLPQYRSLQISFCRCATGIVSIEPEKRWAINQPQSLNQHDAAIAMENMNMWLVFKSLFCRCVKHRIQFDRHNTTKVFPLRVRHFSLKRAGLNEIPEIPFPAAFSDDGMLDGFGTCLPAANGKSRE